jgi:hypothetical protein
MTQETRQEKAATISYVICLFLLLLCTFLFHSFIQCPRGICAFLNRCGFALEKNKVSSKNIFDNKVLVCSKTLRLNEREEDFLLRWFLSYLDKITLRKKSKHRALKVVIFFKAL